MPAGYAEARNIVFHKDNARRDTFPDRGNKNMNTTIEQIAATYPTRSELAPPRAPGLIAQWQSGPQTFSALSSASCVWSSRVSLSMRTNCLMPNES